MRLLLPIVLIAIAVSACSPTPVAEPAGTDQVLTAERLSLPRLKKIAYDVQVKRQGTVEKPKKVYLEVTGASGDRFSLKVGGASSRMEGLPATEHVTSPTGFLDQNGNYRSTERLKNLGVSERLQVKAGTVETQKYVFESGRRTATYWIAGPLLIRLVDRNPDTQIETTIELLALQ